MPIFPMACNRGGKSVADYVLKMKGYVEQLERLGYMLPQDISVGLILNGLTKDFVGFVRNYNMHNMGKTIGEIHAMLIEYEKGLPKKAETPQELEGIVLVYLAELQKKRKQCGSASSSGIEKEAKTKVLFIYVGAMVFVVQVEAIGSFDLVLPNGLVICLDNCHYAPTITRGVVSVSRLVDNGFVKVAFDLLRDALSAIFGLSELKEINRHGMPGMHWVTFWIARLKI
ncbi:hypothetical protein Tco_0865528 [Tanacetum coccineum]